MGAGASASTAVPVTITDEAMPSAREKLAAVHNVFDGLCGAASLSWLEYYIAAVAALEGREEAREPSAVQLLFELEKAASGPAAHEPVSRDAFVEVHLRCGEALSADDYLWYGNLFVKVTHERLEATLHMASVSHVDTNAVDRFLSSRRVEGDDMASGDEHSDSEDMER